MAQTKQLILDSSVIVKWLNRVDEGDLKQSDKLLNQFEAGKISIIAPYLLKFEVGNALLKGKFLSLAEAADAVDSFSKLPIQFVDSDKEVMTRTYELAYEHNITFYDAVFLSLAEKYEATLVTANPKHQKKITGVKVVALKDY